MFVRIRQFINGPNFIKITLLISLVVAVLSMGTAFLFALKVRKLERVVVNHAELLDHFSTGRLPVIKLSNSQIVPLGAYFNTRIGELEKKINELKPPSPSPEPERFKLTP